MADDSPAAATSLVPVREQVVDFYGDTIPAAQVADGTIWVPLRPICEALGLAWSPQRLRLNRDPVLASTQGVIVMITPGGPQSFLALPLKLLPGWLFGIQASRVKPTLRDKILRYQADCYEVLWNAFKGDIVPGPEPPPGQLTEAQRTLELITAMQHLAQQQVDLESRYNTMADYMRGHVRQTNTRLSSAEERLTSLELQLSAGALVSEAQAAEIALAVKAVGSRLTAAGQRDGYQQVYAELYRRYRVSGYKHLPAARYDEVLAWLHGWYAELDEPAP